MPWSGCLEAARGCAHHAPRVTLGTVASGTDQSRQGPDVHDSILPGHQIRDPIAFPETLRLCKIITCVREAEQGSSHSYWSCLELWGFTRMLVSKMIDKPVSHLTCTPQYHSLDITYAGFSVVSDRWQRWPGQRLVMQSLHASSTLGIQRASRNLLISRLGKRSYTTITGECYIPLATCSMSRPPAELGDESPMPRWPMPTIHAGKQAAAQLRGCRRSVSQPRPRRLRDI
jgi:hypothetical protein